MWCVHGRGCAILCFALPRCPVEGTGIFIGQNARHGTRLASALCFLLRADAGGVEGVSSCLLYNTQRSSWDVANRTCYAAASGGHLLTSKQVGCSRLVWLFIL
jgi:hypothetical protein